MRATTKVSESSPLLGGEGKVGGSVSTCAAGDHGAGWACKIATGVSIVTVLVLGITIASGRLTGHIDPDFSDAHPLISTQPNVSLHSDDPKHVKILRFNPCNLDDGHSEALEWATGALRTVCTVDAQSCEFCAWILENDAEYRVNDIVTCLGPTFKVAADAVLSMPKFKGTILHRLLTSKPKTSAGEIAWQEDREAESKTNFAWLVDAIGAEACEVPDRSTLLVHIRAGDNLNLVVPSNRMKSIKSIQAIDAMTAYVESRPYITRIELSSVLHFGNPAPEKAFYTNNSMDADNVGDAYDMSDGALQKNGDILSRFFLAAKRLRRDVWFTSNDDPDIDMCRYAKACHFISASVTASEMRTEGTLDERMSFAYLLRDLHLHLGTCSAEQVEPELGSSPR